MSSTTGFAGPWTTLPTPLTPWILEVIHAMGHTQMTPVQASTIPLFMKNKDVIVEAVTGSGKTLAFVVPVLEKLVRRETRLRKNEIGAFMITPTRELATQIHSIVSLFLSSQPQEPQDSLSECPEPSVNKFPPPLLLVSSSNSSPSQDIQRFLETGADIVIGTPGRIEEFLLGKGANVASVRELEVLVLDEADRLLDLGFHVTLTRIITHLPKQRRTGLFSATMTDADALSELVRVGLRNPTRVVVKVQSKRTIQNSGERGEVVQERRIPASLENLFLRCRASEKILQLTRIISHEVKIHSASQFIVYFATCACVDYFYKVLPAVLPSSVVLHSLHGNLPPSVRTRTLTSFSTTPATPCSPCVLLATDVAARGLDLPRVDVVIQFDPPSDPRAFSHRCGRTARAGRSGKAWVILVGREVEYADFLSVRKIPVQEHPCFTISSSTSQETTSEERLEDPEVQIVLERIRSFLLKDRAVHDKAAKAFVSFVRAYSKHEASYIFRTKDLDLVGLAKSFGLLRLPRMPELKGVDREGWADADIDWDNFSYANEAQEAKRLAARSIQSANKGPEKPLKELKKRAVNSAWSKQAERKEERELRREKKNRKRKWLKAHPEARLPPETKGSTKKTLEDTLHDDDDWEELAREERMAKKVRKGEIDQDAFDAEFGGD